VGGPVVDEGTASASAGEPARSPGLQSRHYCPRTPLEVSAVSAAAERVAALVRAGRRVGWLTLRGDDPQVRSLAASRDLLVVPMPADPAAFAASLYATLHAVDRRSLDAIVVDAPPDDDAWLPVCDRLRRAAAGHVPPR
jgi:L-threonylcarbamoyladenylate synthase